MITKKCPQCGKIFNKTTKHCCLKCYADSMKGISKTKEYESVCAICSKKFFSCKENAKYCSPQCNGKSRIKIHKPKVKGTCKKCGKEFYNRAGVKFCSFRCYQSMYYFGDLSPKMKKCAFCEKEFFTSVKRQKCCSPKCGGFFYVKNNRDKVLRMHKEYYHKKNPRQTYYKNCAICNKAIVTKTKQQLYCGSSCRTKSYRSQEHVRLMRLLDVNKRYAQKNKTIGTLTVDQWKNAKKYFKNCCVYCGKKTEFLQQDHFIPLKLGGNYVYENIVPACSSCNQSKNSKNPHMWIISKFKDGNEIYKKILNYFETIK